MSRTAARLLSFLGLLAPAFLAAPAAPLAAAPAPVPSPDAAVARLDGKRYFPFYWNSVWPHAVHQGGHVYGVFQNSQGQPFAAAFDKQAGTWDGPHPVSDHGLGRDTHGNPSLWVDPDGHVHVFHGSHNNHQRYSVTTKPGDLTQWEEREPVAPLATYPQVFSIGETLHLFFRSGHDHFYPWHHRTSTDRGRTWSRAEEVVDFSRDPIDKYAGSYCYFRPGTDGETFHMFAVYKDDNPRFIAHGVKRENPKKPIKYPGLSEAVYRYNVYHAVGHADGTWTNAAGEPLSLPLTRREANEKCLAINSGDSFAGLQVIAVDAGNRPYVRATVGVTDWAGSGETLVPSETVYATVDAQGIWRKFRKPESSWPQPVRERFRRQKYSGTYAFNPEAGMNEARPWIFNFDFTGPDKSAYLYLLDGDDAAKPRDGGAMAVH